MISDRGTGTHGICFSQCCLHRSFLSCLCRRALTHAVKLHPHLK